MLLPEITVMESHGLLTVCVVITSGIIANDLVGDITGARFSTESRVGTAIGTLLTVYLVDY